MSGTDGGPSSSVEGARQDRCGARLEVRPHRAKGSRGRVSHRRISPIENGPRPIVTAEGRIRGRMPIVLPLSAIGRSHPGNVGYQAWRE